MSTQQDLEGTVRYVLEELEEAYNEENIYEWLDDVLNIEYTKNLHGFFVGCNIAVTLGGPNVYVNTISGDIEGYWGCDFACIPIPDEIRDEIDYTIEDIAGSCV